MFSFADRTRALLEGIAQAGTVSAAARNLGLDPSNALRHLRTAERHAGAGLVERSRGGWARGGATLTRAGASLLSRSRVAGDLNAWNATALEPDTVDGVTPIRIGTRTLLAAGLSRPGLVRASLRPEDVVLERAPRRGALTSLRNSMPMRVQRWVQGRPGVLDVVLVAGAFHLRARITRGALRDLRLRPGTRVIASVKATAIRLEPWVDA